VSELVEDLMGHTFDPATLQRLMEAHRASKKRWEKRFPDDPYDSMGKSRDCVHCGRTIDFEWSGVEGEPMTLGHQCLPPHLWKEDFRAEEPEDLRCPVPDPKPTAVRFTCRSGRVALANDLREHLSQEVVKQGHRVEIGSHAGRVAYIEHYAKNGYLTNCVGNTKIWFVPHPEGGLDIYYPGSGEDRIEDDVRDAIDQQAVHTIFTEVWWFGIMDVADLPDGATDSYNREIGFLDLTPGEYEFVAHPETSGAPLVATLRRVGDLPPDPTPTIETSEAS